MPSITTTRKWVLNAPITGEPILEGPGATFSLKTADLPSLKDDQVLVHVKFLSNDPGQRGWIASDISAERSYTDPVHANETMRSNVIAEVVESKAPSIPNGALVSTFAAGWTEYAVLDAASVQLLPDVPGVSPTHFLGALGITGLTALYGTTEIAEANTKDVLVVSGAAGATGSMVVQIAKHIVGCKTVIGVAGSEKKCEWVKSLGADICLNYRSPTFSEDLVAATPELVDVYFDNVGGEILDFVLARMQRHGRVVVCGAISSYNNSPGVNLKNWLDVVTMRLQIKGFIVFDWLQEVVVAEKVKELADAARQGKIKIDDDIETIESVSFEDIPRTWMKLFKGFNNGKLVTAL